MDERYVVYVLSNPHTDEVRYVGKTKQPLKRRLARHMRDAEEAVDGKWLDTTHRATWIRSLHGRPKVEIVEEFSTLEAVNEAEVFWISYLRFLGIRLVNTTDGGDGGIVSRKGAISDDDLVRLYKDGASTSKIARTFNTCKKRVSQVLSKQGIQRRSALKPVVDDVGNIFKSISDAARHYDVSIGAISNYLRGKSKSAAGHTFRYL